jgi:heme exporter protein B
MPQSAAIRYWWWIVHKDLLREWRAPRAWPAAAALGLVLSLVVAMQLDLPGEQRTAVAGGLFWLAAFFAAAGAIERSIASEQDEGCWTGLFLFPAPPAVVFLAKVTVNFVTLGLLNAVLIPAFLAFSGITLAGDWRELVGIVLAANLGVAAAGAIVAALTLGLRQRSGLSALIMLPLISPVILGAAQATRLLLAGERGVLWGGWGQLLAAFAALLLVLGAMLFEFAIEE